MNLLKKNLSEADRVRIAEAIAAVEKRTGGEVCVELRQRRSPAERQLPIETLARRAFLDLGMMRTRDRTGVLVFLLLEDRQFCIFADEGIHSRVGPGVWTAIASGLSTRLREGGFTDGLVEAVEAVGKLLELHVPRRPDDSDELPNTVKIS